MHQGVVRDAVLEVLELLGIRKVAVDQEVRDLNERSVFGQFFDGVTAVTKDSVFPVEVSNGTLRGSGVFESVIQRDVTRLHAQLGDVNGFLLFRTFDYWEFIRFPIQN